MITDAVPFISFVILDVLAKAQQIKMEEKEF